ncbi:sporulation histidine kinase inhibitor Sda [Sporosarcina sp. UB5]|uniref:sporulation histidine kinase inhibitor Sda n=1 Tax=Sporosarcina sp. UB5 TaxID=3047463 RepID=UPI003D78EAE5
MISLPDDFLMDSYRKAVALKLCPQFITLLEKEMRRRSIHSPKRGLESPKESESVSIR